MKNCKRLTLDTRKIKRGAKVMKLLTLSLSAAALILLFAACSAASVISSETDGRFIRIILETRSGEAFANGAEWKAETQGDGAIEEISHHEYFDAVEKALAKNAPADDGKLHLPDMPVPGGYIELYYKGVRPGTVDLLVACLSPGRSVPYAEAKFKFSVSSNMKISVLDASEKYDWDDSE